MSAELSAKEEALVMGIVKEVTAEPGLPARDLGVLLHSQMATVLRVTQKLVDSGILERRQIRRMRSDGLERGYSGLFLTDKPVAKPAAAETPETLATRGVPAAANGSVQARAQLRELGARLGWSRLPLTPAREFGGGVRFGRAIQGGEEGWQQALRELSDEDVEVALSAGRRLLPLLAPQAMV